MTEKHRENPDKWQELRKSKENAAWYSATETQPWNMKFENYMPFTILLH